MRKFTALSIYVAVLAATSTCWIGCDGFLEVRGFVHDDRGKAIQGAKVVLERGEGPKFEVNTDPEGCFSTGGSIAPGDRTYTLHVEADGYDPLAAEISTASELPLDISLKLTGSGHSRSQTTRHIPCR